MCNLGVSQDFKPVLYMAGNGGQRVFPCGSAGKEYTCNVGDLGSIPWLGRSPGEGKVFWPGEFHGLYRPWGHKESNMSEQLSLSLEHREFEPPHRGILCLRISCLNS